MYYMYNYTYVYVVYSVHKSSQVWTMTWSIMHKNMPTAAEVYQN